MEEVPEEAFGEIWANGVYIDFPETLSKIKQLRSLRDY